jgi:hypothetical protein
MADELSAKLQSAVAGLEYPSESDAPFDVIRWSSTSASARDAVAAKAGNGKIEGVPVDAFFEELKDTSDADRFAQLQQVLVRELRDVRVFRVGEMSIDIYMIGKTPAGEWAGVHTVSVET